MTSVGDKSLPKRLIAFDFDHTIVDDNTDIVVRGLVEMDKIPHEITKMYTSTGWIPYMQAIFKILHKHGIQKSEIIDAVRKIPEVPGMINCLKYLSSNNFDIIIISDSNSEFITQWNEYQNISKYVNAVFTNPAEFNGEQLLLVNPFHHQTECSISSSNLCKGKVLNDYLLHKQNNDVVYDNVLFVGDGFHDICGMLKLNSNGFACPRINYAAERDLYSTANKISTEVQASVIKWNDGHSLLNDISKMLKLENC